MTVQQLKNLVGTKEYICSSGDTLYKVCLAVYGSYSETYAKILLQLNHVLNWHNLRVNQVLFYVPLSEEPDLDD